MWYQGQRPKGQVTLRNKWHCRAKRLRDKRWQSQVVPDATSQRYWLSCRFAQPQLLDVRCASIPWHCFVLVIVPQIERLAPPRIGELYPEFTGCTLSFTPNSQITPRIRRLDPELHPEVINSTPNSLIVPLIVCSMHTLYPRPIHILYLTMTNSTPNSTPNSAILPQIFTDSIPTITQNSLIIPQNDAIVR